ncbi:MAG TPA: hypothetical protein VJJ22_04395 [Candidatus Paceibacterota bacterium]
MSKISKQITASILLISFVVIVLFGFNHTMQGMDGMVDASSGSGDCPYISAFSSFLNVPPNNILNALIYSLLIAVAILLTALIRRREPVLILDTLFNSKPLVIREPSSRKITSWLSRLEHSPSIA